MIEWLAALLMVQAVPVSPPPTDVRVEAFRAACVPHRRDVEAAAVALAADGWAVAPDDDHPELASTMGRARAEAVDPELKMTADFTIWKKVFGARAFYVVLNRVDAVLRAEDRDDDGDGVIQPWEAADTMAFLGCGLWDFDADAPIDPAAVTAWVGAGPIQTFDQPGVIQGGTWNVFAIMPGTAEVHVGFIPDGGLGYDRTGFSGVSITMTSAPLSAEDQAADAAADVVSGGD